MDAMTVAQLKEKLREMNETVTGKQAELGERLRETNAAAEGFGPGDIMGVDPAESDNPRLAKRQK